MARKDSVSDWDETANNNDNVGGVNIAENCAAANLNNAIRTVMAQIKTYSLAAEPGLIYSTKNADYTALAADDNTFFRFTADSTLSLTAAATLATGWQCWVKADGGSVTIDPNAAETINGATTLVIGDGYSAFVVCTGAAFYAVLIPRELQPYASVTSAATTDLGAATSQNILMSGSATITSFGTAPAGTERYIVFSSAVTLTHNATSLILPTGSNITTIARDSLRAVSLGSGNWRVTTYVRGAEYVTPTLTVGDGLTSTGSLSSGTMEISLDIYTGSSSSNTNFPVGARVVVFADGVSIARNGLIIPALNTAVSGGFVRSVHANAGALLAGTWRARGGFGDGHAQWYEAERVS